MRPTGSWALSLSPPPGPALTFTLPDVLAVHCVPSIPLLPPFLLPSLALLQRLRGGAPGALRPPWAGAGGQPEWLAVWEGRRASLAGRGLRALPLSA